MVSWIFIAWVIILDDEAFIDTFELLGEEEEDGGEEEEDDDEWIRLEMILPKKYTTLTLHLKNNLWLRNEYSAPQPI